MILNNEVLQTYTS